MGKMPKCEIEYAKRLTGSGREFIIISSNRGKRHIQITSKNHQIRKE